MGGSPSRNIFNRSVWFLLKLRSRAICNFEAYKSISSLNINGHHVHGCIKCQINYTMAVQNPKKLFTSKMFIISNTRIHHDRIIGSFVWVCTVLVCSVSSFRFISSVVFLWTNLFFAVPLWKYLLCSWYLFTVAF